MGRLPVLWLLPVVACVAEIAAPRPFKGNGTSHGAANIFAGVAGLMGASHTSTTLRAGLHMKQRVASDSTDFARGSDATSGTTASPASLSAAAPFVSDATDASSGNAASQSGMHTTAAPFASAARDATSTSQPPTSYTTGDAFTRPQISTDAHPTPDQHQTAYVTDSAAMSPPSLGTATSPASLRTALSSGSLSTAVPVAGSSAAPATSSADLGGGTRHSNRVGDASGTRAAYTATDGSGASSGSLRHARGPAAVSPEKACSGEEHKGRFRISCDGGVLRLVDPDLWAGKHTMVWSVELDATYAVLPGSSETVFQSFIGALLRLPKLTVLNVTMKHTDLGQDHVRNLLVGLGGLPSLQAIALDLSSSLFFPDAANAVPALGVAGLGSLAGCSELTSLSLALAGNGLGPQGARDVALGLARLPNLQFLNLDVSMNSVQDVGAWELGASLGRLSHLSSLSLNLRLSSLTAAGLLELSEGLSGLRRLTSLRLDVSYNNFGDTSASTLATSSLGAKLVELAEAALLVEIQLDMSGTDLGPSQVQHLAAALLKLRRAGKSIKVVGMLLLPEAQAASPGLGPTDERAMWLLTTSPAAPSPVTSTLPADGRLTETTQLRMKQPSSTTVASPSATAVQTKAPEQSVLPTAAPVTAASLSQTAVASIAPASGVVRTADKGRSVPQAAPAVHTSRLPHRSHAAAGASAGRVGRASVNETSGEDRLSGPVYQSPVLIVGILIALSGGALACGGGVCSPRGRQAGSINSGSRMTMLGSDDEQRRPARSSGMALSAPADRGEQRSLRAGAHGNNKQSSNFADFASFSDNVPVVQSWTGASSSSASRSASRGDRFDSASDSLEAMLEAQVAALDDGSSDRIADWPE